MNFEKSELHDRIEDFLEGRLSEEENIEFREQLISDKELYRLYRQRIAIGITWMKAKKYEKTRHSVSEIIREVKSDTKNKLFIWSAAASIFILLSVSGIVIFNHYPATQIGMAEKSQGVETPVVPHIKFAEEKASIHFMDELKMLAPINNKTCNRNDSIVFTWLSKADAESNIIIENQNTGKTVYREKIKINSGKFVLEKNFLPEGKYQWSIEGFPGKEKFSIVSSEK